MQTLQTIADAIDIRVGATDAVDICGWAADAVDIRFEATDAAWCSRDLWTADADAALDIQHTDTYSVIFFFYLAWAVESFEVYSS